MTTTKHGAGATRGGARPKVRPDDGRKNNRPTVHTGRPPSRFAVKVGDGFRVTTTTAEGLTVFPSAVWQVAEITRSHVVFVANNGDRVKLLR